MSFLSNHLIPTCITQSDRRHIVTLGSFCRIVLLANSVRLPVVKLRVKADQWNPNIFQASAIPVALPEETGHDQMKALISLTIAAGYGGAPMVMLEIAEELRSRGYEVDICLWWGGKPMWQHFVDAGVRRIDNIRDANPFDYDIAMFLHHCAPLHFMEIKPGSRERTLVLFFRLSHSSSVGAPGVCLDDLIADRVLVNSIEVRDRMITEFGVSERDLYVFSNAAPSGFAKVRRTKPTSLRKVLYVSKYGNPEVIDALRILRDRHGLETAMYGGTKGIHERITPEIIADADAVITMAKTAQFCLLAGVPIYVYDYDWGGPGYLSADNYDNVSANNFSGSGCPRLVDGETIAQEVISGHDSASRYMLAIPDDELVKYSLEPILNDILSMADTAMLNSERIAGMRQHEHLLNRERCRAQYAHMAFRNWRITLRDRVPRQSRFAMRDSTQQHAASKTEVCSFNHAGVNVEIAGSPGDYISSYVSKQQTFYELELLEFIRSQCVGGVYVDAGANIGNHTVYFGLFCQPELVYSFEPYSVTRERLIENISRNRLTAKVRTVGAALGDTCGSCGLSVPSSTNVAKVYVSDGNDVEIVRVDDVVTPWHKVGLMKIDVGGCGAKVLQGAMTALDRDRPMLIVESRTAEEQHEIESLIRRFDYREVGRSNATQTFVYVAESSATPN